jgi:basic membrane lipoprotein Med (substrate-binding protein (PBP1-ABC) superfamily)
MLLIEGVTRIKPSYDKKGLVLEIEGGMEIYIAKDNGPDYIDIQSYLADNKYDLVITVAITWDDSNIEEER